MIFSGVVMGFGYAHSRGQETTYSPPMCDRYTKEHDICQTPWWSITLASFWPEFKHVLDNIY